MSIFTSLAGRAASVASGTWWVKPALGGIAVLAVGGAVGAFSHSRFNAGKHEAEATCQIAAAKVAADAQQAVNAANARAAKAEGIASSQIDDAAKAYEKGMTDAKTDFDQRIAALRSGSSRLRVSVTSCRSAGGSKLPATSTGASVGDGATTADISGFVAQRLTERAHDADNVVRQLTACQAIVRTDREAVNTQ